MPCHADAWLPARSQSPIAYKRPLLGNPPQFTYSPHSSLASSTTRFKSDFTRTSHHFYRHVIQTHHCSHRCNRCPGRQRRTLPPQGRRVSGSRADEERGLDCSERQVAALISRKTTLLNVDKLDPTETELKEKGVEVVKADFNDVKSLEEAFKGAHGVFGVTNCASSSPFNRSILTLTLTSIP